MNENEYKCENCGNPMPHRWWTEGKFYCVFCGSLNDQFNNKTLILNLRDPKISNARHAQCKFCNNALNKRENFCGFCGYKYTENFPSTATSTNNRKNKSRNSFSIGIIIGLFVILIIAGVIASNINSNQSAGQNPDNGSVNDQSQNSNINTITTPSVQRQANNALMPSSPQASPCTSFDYTRWSHCAPDGTQSRVITAAYPGGCTIIDSTSVTQQQNCQYVPMNLSIADVVNKMVWQIRNAPDQTIVTQYLVRNSGNIYIVTNKWKLSADGDYLFLEYTIKSRATGEIINHIILDDTNKDFRPEGYSYDGNNWSDISSQGSDIVLKYNTIWGVAAAYFGSYLMN